MARREPGAIEARRGRGDLAGIILFCVALLLFAALFSFDRFDLAANRVPPNDPAHNLIGRFGASMAYWLFLYFGAGAYLLPVLVLGFAVAHFLSEADYLKRKWPWAILLVLVCAAALDLGTDQAALKRLARNPADTAGFLDRLSLNLSAPSAGGVIGMNLNRYCFRYFGTVGSSILLATLYLVALYGLTNFHLGDWIR